MKRRNTLTKTFYLIGQELVPNIMQSIGEGIYLMVSHKETFGWSSGTLWNLGTIEASTEPYYWHVKHGMSMVKGLELVKVHSSLQATPDTTIKLDD